MRDMLCLKIPYGSAMLEDMVSKSVVYQKNMSYIEQCKHSTATTFVVPLRLHPSLLSHPILNLFHLPDDDKLRVFCTLLDVMRNDVNILEI